MKLMMVEHQNLSSEQGVVFLTLKVERRSREELEDPMATWSQPWADPLETYTLWEKNNPLLWLSQLQF
jgi:hypothetical protein